MSDAISDVLPEAKSSSRPLSARTIPFGTLSTTTAVTESTGQSSWHTQHPYTPTLTKHEPHMAAKELGHQLKLTSLIGARHFSKTSLRRYLELG